MINRVLLLGFYLGHARLPGALRVAEVLGHGVGSGALWGVLIGVGQLPGQRRLASGSVCSPALSAE